MRFVTVIIAAVLAAYAAGYYLAVPANPEIQLWSHVVQQRDVEISEVRNEQPDTPIIFFTGGSSTAFSIDPRIIESKTGLPVFNLGLPVAAGAHYILHRALEKCRPGDILVVCLEPDLMLYPQSGPVSTRFSFALAANLGHPAEAAGGQTFGHQLSFQEWLHHPRPGARYLCTLAGRTLGGKGYRYKKSDLRYRGHMVTPIIDEHTPSTENFFVPLPDSGRHILETLKVQAESKAVHVTYSMPWRLTQSTAIDHNREINRRTLAEFEFILPILEDGYSGAIDDVSYYSDSEWHLTAEGAKKRSEALAIPLHAWIQSF